MSALIQTASGGGVATTLVIAFPSANVAGNTLVVYWSGGGTISSVTDTLGNTYVSSPATSGTLYVISCRGGANSTTFTFTGSVYAEGAVAEFTAASSGGGYDASAVATGTSGTASSGNVTTAVNGELIVGLAAGGSAYTAGSGFTAVGTNPGGSQLEYQVQATAGAIAATFTLTSATWFASVLTFKPIVTTPRLMLLGAGS